MSPQIVGLVVGGLLFVKISAYLGMNNVLVRVIYKIDI